jgi:hypothetical protein
VSAENPLEELTHVIELSEEGLLPPEAGLWATSARVRAERLLETIEDMLANGQLAPTRRQAKALENVHATACAWMGPLQSRPLKAKAVAASGRCEVDVGSTVRLDDGKTYVIGVDVSADSPVGRALMGHVCGDTVAAAMPRGGTKEMTIADVKPGSRRG